MTMVVIRSVEDICKDAEAGYSFAELREKYCIRSRFLDSMLKKATINKVLTSMIYDKLTKDPSKLTFPENLELQFDALLTSNNSTLKQILMLFIANNVDTSTKIKHELTSILSHTDFKIPSVPAIQYAIQMNFVNNGLVTYDDGSFNLTYAGSSLGAPIS